MTGLITKASTLGTSFFGLQINHPVTWFYTTKLAARSNGANNHLGGSNLITQMFCSQSVSWQLFMISKQRNWRAIFIPIAQVVVYFIVGFFRLDRRPWFRCHCDISKNTVVFGSNLIIPGVVRKAIKQRVLLTA